jgi:hypothetical protein
MGVSSYEVAAMRQRCASYISAKHRSLETCDRANANDQRDVVNVVHWQLVTVFLTVYF